MCDGVPVATDMPKNDKAFLDWYSRLIEDRVRRRMHLLRDNEGLFAHDDVLQWLVDHGLGPRNPFPDEDEVARRMGLPRRTKDEADQK